MFAMAGKTAVEAGTEPPGINIVTILELNEVSIADTTSKRTRSVVSSVYSSTTYDPAHLPITALMRSSK